MNGANLLHLLVSRRLKAGVDRMRESLLPARLKRAIKVIQHANDSALARMFYLWGLRARTNTKDAHIHALTKHPRIIDGAAKLDALTSRRPRNALRSCVKKQTLDQRRDQAV
jgi:hypothetical protein